MVTTEERLARLEGRVEEHSHMFTGLQETLSRFEQRVDRRFEQIDGRLTALDQKLDQTRIGLEARIDAVDVKVGDLHRKSDARFKWVASLLGACLTSIIACLIGILLRP